MQDLLVAVDKLLVQGEVKKAEVLLARYLRGDLDRVRRADALIYRARTRLRGLRPDDAISDLVVSRELIPECFDQLDVIELLGDCYLARFELASVGFADRDDTVRAWDCYSQILDRGNDYANIGWIHYQLGRIALSNNDVNTAETHFHQALLKPSTVASLTAYCYERLGFIAFYEKRDLNSAKGFLDKAVFTYPATDPKAWLVQVYILSSRVLREQRNYSGAVEAAGAAVEIASNNSDAGPEITEALLVLAELLSSMDNRNHDVISYLQRFMLISKKPLGVDVTWSRVHEMLGDAYFNLGQYAEASEAYEAALHYNPYHPWEQSLHYRIARSYYQQNAYNKAIEAIERLLASANADGETIRDYRIYDVLGNAQFALGLYPEAQLSYQSALQVAPAGVEGTQKIRQYLQLAQDLS